LTVVKNTPHPEKVAKGGEDAWFINIPDNSFAVADGVGGYDQYGVDSGLYSKQFMQLAMTKDLEQKGTPAPQEVIAYAHSNTKLPGACTACVVQLDAGVKKLYAANVGDSGFLIIRDGELAIQSPSMQHYFDCPFQLCNQDTAPSDTAEDAMLFELDVQVGDVIVAASDGLFDNVFTDELVRVVNVAMKESKGLQANVAAAAALSKLAFANSSDDTYDSPYAQESTKEQQRMMEAQKEKVKSMPGPFGGMLGKVAGAAMSQVQPAKGGKQDDITVVVATVVDAAQSKAELEAAAAAAEAAIAPVREQLDAGIKTFQAKSAPKPKTKVKALDGATFTAAQIDAMDKTSLQTMLQKYGLPTSGRIDKLKERLAEVAVVDK